MLYLSRFEFPDEDREWAFFMGVKRQCYNSFYPFQVLSSRGVTALDFEPITILYGGNGSGKTTALNVIAQSLGLQRDTRFNQSSFFGDYVQLCHAEMRQPLTDTSRVITSDDVFDYMLNLRAINEGVDERREELFQEYLDDKYSNFKYRTMEDYERLKKVNLSRRKTQSQYVKTRLMENLREQSNGESAYFYFTGKIRENGLYLLDEPENSLSPARQQELVQFLEDSARFFGCQFIMATHSPFLLAMRGARIYDLDARPVRTCRWTELEAVRAYHDFFRKHAVDFDERE
ncbi:MAG: AAA family ATPase [Clostridiales bacterium]|nr:AAA family ATPase [Clostridiales bacterium]